MTKNNQIDREFTIRSKHFPWEECEYVKKVSNQDKYIWEHKPSGRKFIRVIRWEEIRDES